MAKPIDRKAFDRLVLESLAALQAFAIRLTGSPDAAEELAQETLVRAARSWRTFAGKSKFRTWLFQIAVNAFRDSVSRMRIAGELPAEIADTRADDPARCVAASETGRIVAREISRLPPRQREVLVLIAYEQMSFRDIAEVLGTSEQNVRTNLHLARQRLKERLAHFLTSVNP